MVFYLVNNCKKVKKFVSSQFFSGKALHFYGNRNFLDKRDCDKLLKAELGLLLAQGKGVGSETDECAGPRDGGRPWAPSLQLFRTVSQ